MSVPPRFDDPSLQAIADFLTAGPVRTPVTAEDLAAREGLDLGRELAAVQRRVPSSRRRPSTHRPTASTRSTPGRRLSLRDHAARLVEELAPALRPHLVRARAEQWAQLGLWPHETEAWMRALGVGGAATAAACRRWQIGLAALEVMVQGRHVRRRLRDGEPISAVIALAAGQGIDLAG